MNTYFGRRGQNVNLVMVSTDTLEIDEKPATVALDISASRAIYCHALVFDWGYGGDASAQLALAILLSHTGSVEETKKFADDFKWDFVSGWGDSWKITGKEIDAWLLSKRQGTKGFTGSPRSPSGPMGPTAHIPLTRDIIQG